MNPFLKLYDKLEQTDIDDFYTVDSAFFLELYDAELEDCPAATAFMTVFNWYSDSLRSGVWTFYEIADPADLELTVNYLEQSGELELKEIFQSGIHDYQNPKYQDCEYPKEWLDETDQIDSWIAGHEKWLYEWEKSLLLSLRPVLCPK